MTYKLIILTTVAGFLAGCGHSEPEQAAASLPAEFSEFTDVELQLPSDYRSTGPYMISDRLGQEDQVIVLYANATARFGTQTDGKLPSDSVIVGEIYTARTDADGTISKSQINRRIPDELKAIVMMERRAGWGDQYPDLLKVGDWEFEVFSPKGENLGKNTMACRECHAPLTESEYVFSYDHLAAAN